MALKTSYTRFNPITGKDEQITYRNPHVDTTENTVSSDDDSKELFHDLKNNDNKNIRDDAIEKLKVTKAPKVGEDWGFDLRFQEMLQKRLNDDAACFSSKSTENVNSRSNDAKYQSKVVLKDIQNYRNNSLLSGDASSISKENDRTLKNSSNSENNATQISNSRASVKHHLGSDIFNNSTRDNVSVLENEKKQRALEYGEFLRQQIEENSRRRR